MGKITRIQWTLKTWNPWWGCDKVSPGCAHCYAEHLMMRWGKGFAIRRTSDATFYAPLSWKAPSLIFTCSMSDWFHPGADAWRGEAWDIIRRTPQHIYQILTKRPERIAENLPYGWPLPNVWLGVSTEYQRWADARIPLLLASGTTVNFISAEPLLGPLDLSKWLCPDGLDWVIVGGESGPKARPVSLEWIRDIIRQCRDARIPVFVKQLGAMHRCQHDDKGGCWYCWPEDLQVRGMPETAVSLLLQEKNKIW